VHIDRNESNETRPQGEQRRGSTIRTATSFFDRERSRSAFITIYNWQTKYRGLFAGVIAACAISSNANSQQQDQGAGAQQAAPTQSSQKSKAPQRQQAAKSQEKKQAATQQRALKSPPAVSQRSPAYSKQSESDADTASSGDVRQFHEVLNDLLSEFAYDVKEGQINGLKNLSIRRVDISDTLPRTYEQYVELLVTERIRENSKIKIINCIQCKSKSSTMIEGKLMISSPLTNLQKMDEAANQLGIENYMDVVLVYHTTHMVLAFNVFNTQTKEMTWARTFNSETLRSRYQRMAVDRNQIEKSRASDVYVPDYKFLVGLSGSQLPNVAGTARDKSFIGLHLRAVEKFDNRRTDFGLLTSIWANTSKFLKSYPSEGTASTDTTTTYTGTARALPYKYVLGLHAVAARNFIGDVEMYDRIRHGVHFGIGAIISTGYLAPSARLGWDMYFGRRFVVTLGTQYITSSVVLVGSSYTKVKGGGGGDFILSYNF
jgi:hypothetical protein